MSAVRSSLLVGFVLALLALATPCLAQDRGSRDGYRGGDGYRSDKVGRKFKGHNDLWLVWRQCGYAGYAESGKGAW